jgi:hypothetical protein
MLHRQENMLFWLGTMLALLLVASRAKRETKVAHQSNYAISSAIENCMDRCRHSEEPLACLAETLQELRDRLWKESDVQLVELATRRVLLRVLVTRYVEPYELV